MACTASSAGREVRIEAAPGGVRVEPLDVETEPVVRKLLGAEFDLEGFASFARDDPVLARVVPALAGLRPPLAPEPFETLVTSITAQQVSLRAAFAIRNRLIERFGEQAVHAYAFPTRERLAAAEPAELRELGFSQRKAEYVVALARSDLELDALGDLSDEEISAADRPAGDRRVDGRLVPRPAPRPSASLACRRSRAAQGGRRNSATAVAR